jgi:hypothetical protein
MPRDLTFDTKRLSLPSERLANSKNSHMAELGKAKGK